MRVVVQVMFFCIAACASLRAEVSVGIDHSGDVRADAPIEPSAVAGNNIALSAKFYLISGKLDGNGAQLDALHDGRIAAEADDPDSNVFFSPKSDGGRIGIDLGQVCDVKQVRSLSWHPSLRAPQAYTIWGADGSASGFQSAPAQDVDPSTCGWREIAAVDTHQKFATAGGEYVVSLADSAGLLGKFRYLMLDISKGTPGQVDGNTFYSEIQVFDDKPGELIEPVGKTAGITPGVKRLTFGDGRYTAVIDTVETPELRQWAESGVAAMVIKWYPKLVAMLPSDGYTAPAHFSITFRKNKSGVADTNVNRINCAAAFFDKEMHGQGLGAILHEMVHVVQHYPYGKPHLLIPNYLVEGIPDYVRWYDFEPQTHGAEISKSGLAKANFDGSYRITANFLHYVSQHFDDHLVAKLNAILRQGVYADSFWQTDTGEPLAQLNDEWKKSLIQQRQ